MFKNKEQYILELWGKNEVCSESVHISITLSVGLQCTFFSLLLQMISTG